MRVLFLADAVFDDLPGGSRVVARELAWQLIENGHDVTMLVARQRDETPSDEVTDRGVRIVRYEGASKAFKFVNNGEQACRRLWAEKPFDIVHTHFAYAAVGPLRAIPKTVPHIRSFHGPWDEEMWVQLTRHKPSPLHKVVAQLKVALARQVELKNLQASSHVVTLSKVFSNVVTSRCGISQRKVQIIPGGADIERFNIADKIAQRKRLGLPEDAKILFSVRRLAPRMGLDNLIKSVAQIVPQRPDVFLVIGGKGPEAANLKALVDELGLTDHVRMPGFIADADLASYYQAADVFVLPTVALEGFGLVTAEALACGVPVIGTPVGAIPETLEGLDKRLIASGVDSDALAKSIGSFLNDGWADSLTPDRLRTYVLQRYTWERHASAVEAIYNDALSTAGNSHVRN